VRFVEGVVRVIGDARPRTSWLVHNDAVAGTVHMMEEARR